MEMKYYINKEKRVVVCVGDNCEDDAMIKVTKRDGNLAIAARYLMDRHGKKVWMKNRFVGKAYCSEDDEWDEEIGKSLAKERMMNAYVLAKAKKMREIADTLYDAAAECQESMMRYKDKVNKVVGYPLFDDVANYD